MRSSVHKLVTLGFGLGVLAAPLAAQDRGRGRDAVPNGYEPPRGMCRIWIEGVPAGQQPAPTDCATAIKKRPSNASVVFGEPLRTLEEAERVRERLRERDQWAPRRETGNSRSRESSPERQPAPRPRTERATPQPAPRARTEPARTEPQAPRTRSEPARTAPATRPASPPPSGATRGRVERTSPPPGYTDDLLARERWLDEELLASLYGEGPPGGGAPPSGWMDDGRVAPPGAVGERGRGRSGADSQVPWARSANGQPLTAREVEVRVRGELALVGGQYGYAGGYAAAGYDPSLLEPRPGECSDRNFDGRCDDLMAGADGCADRNGDGRCDDARYDPVIDACPPGVRCDPYSIRRAREGVARDGAGGVAGRGTSARPDRRLDGAANYSAGYCFDRDRDGRCDEPWTSGDRIPQTLPEMASAVALRRGVPSYDVERWLQRTDAQARVTDRDGDGLPERVTWIDGSGRIVQVWTDRDGDGIADRVELFRDGLPVQVIAR